MARQRKMTEERLIPTNKIFVKKIKFDIALPDAYTEGNSKCIN